jgi:hypothetical protein
VVSSSADDMLYLTGQVAIILGRIGSAPGTGRQKSEVLQHELWRVQDILDVCRTCSAVICIACLHF